MARMRSQRRRAYPVAINALIFITLTCVRSGEALKSHLGTDRPRKPRLEDPKREREKVPRPRRAPLRSGDTSARTHRRNHTHPHRTGVHHAQWRDHVHQHPPPTPPRFFYPRRRSWGPIIVPGPGQRITASTKKRQKPSLAHKKRNAYDRSTLFEKRIAIMDDWANYLNI